ncbi:MAG: 16S rRNA (cytosine(967)-C(5))-methyltransferase RsmB [Desulfobacterales bacterium]|jgi:16S rRNA (cytosine967-C5)-methyltransferase|nr:16S rRNA (cytosine(967)-C(5))-methyltransferase RsmB [Desulfobacterales bacterium]
MPVSSRQTALNILNALEKSRHHLDRIFSDITGKETDLPKRDRDFINSLVYGALRWRNQLDWILSRHSAIRVEKIDPCILNILRIGLFQIFHLDRIPESAAVNTSVEMAKKNAPPWVAGFVNAVLRNAARNKTSLVYPDVQKDPKNAVPILTSFPGWLIDRWLIRFGVEGTLNLCNACNSIPELAIRANTLKASRKHLLAELEGEAEDVRITRYAPDGISFHHPLKPIHDMDSFKSGLFQVQDEAAQLISFALAPLPGEKILDACAGLGGKTGHIAQLMKNKGQLIALDKDSSKIFRLNHEIKRLGIEIVVSRIDDLGQIGSKAYGKFDRILLDAPCSGIGVIRRNPDIKWDASRQNLLRYNANQVRLLGHASQLVKPFGKILYAVCSFEPEENEMVIHEFLKTHGNFDICNLSDQALINMTPFLDEKGFFRSLPHVHHMDGFFCACLQKKHD